AAAAAVAVTAASTPASKVERTLERQEKAKAEEEALRGRGAGDEDEWRLEYLKGLNAGLGNQEAKDAADNATGRATKPPASAASKAPPISKPAARSSPAMATAAGGGGNGGIRKSPKAEAPKASKTGNPAGKNDDAAAMRKLHLALVA
ncbi:unnamed protein product, partial [Scytosiphon promiscuus]